jgi:hypothetical protein
MTWLMRQQLVNALGLRMDQEEKFLVMFAILIFVANGVKDTYYIFKLEIFHTLIIHDMEWVIPVEDIFRKSLRSYRNCKF